MTTYELLLRQRERLKKSKMDIQEITGCDERTLRQYLNGTTTSGPYLTLLLEVLEISVEEWNLCENLPIRINNAEVEHV